MGLMSFLERRLQSMKKQTAMTCVTERTEKPVQGSTAFALDLYHSLRKASSGNLFLSPFSVSSCLGMVYLGAHDETASQIARCLHLETDNRTPHVELASPDTELLAGYHTAKITLRTANSLWGDKRFPVLSEYLGTLVRHYQSVFQEVDFSNSSEACERINHWVEENTNDLIHNIVNEDDVRSAVLVLANAIYFKGKWSKPFKKENTELEPFFLGSGTSVEVSMMTQHAAGWYARLQDLQILEKWYGEGEFSMMVLLPDRYDGLQRLEESLSSHSLDRWLSMLEPVEKMYIQLPKFRIECRPPVKDALVEMGMVDAFDKDAADFSGMTGNRDFYVGNVIHKALIEVEEEGTEAAAATAVMMFMGCAPDSEPTLVFRADHPFMFLIRHNPSKTILFAGRVVDPRTHGKMVRSNFQECRGF